MPVLSTRRSRVLVDSTVMLSSKWTLELEGDEVDVTTFETGGFGDYLSSYVSARFNVDCFYGFGAGENPWAAAPTLYAGLETSLSLYLKRAPDTHRFIFPYVVILKVDTDVAVHDVCRYKFTGRAKGSFSYPGGTSYSGIVE